MILVLLSLTEHFIILRLSDIQMRQFNRFVPIRQFVPKLSITGFYRATMTILGIQMKDEGSMALNFCEFY